MVNPGDLCAVNAPGSDCDGFLVHAINQVRPEERPDGADGFWRCRSASGRALLSCRQSDGQVSYAKEFALHESKMMPLRNSNAPDEMQLITGNARVFEMKRSVAELEALAAKLDQLNAALKKFGGKNGNV
jgi:hypothetical protein